MSDRELWLLSLAVATVVVVVVTLLLGLIVAVLKNIDRNAADVSTAGKRIAENTVALWTLEQTDRDWRGSPTLCASSNEPSRRPLRPVARRFPRWPAR